MCEFKPGDEVICVNDSSFGGSGLVWKGAIKAGSVYVVSSVFLIPTGHPRAGNVVIGISECPNICVALGIEIGYRPSRFRKIQRRDLTAWLKTATKFEEPKRKKANA